MIAPTLLVGLGGNRFQDCKPCIQDGYRGTAKAYWFCSI